MSAQVVEDRGPHAVGPRQSRLERNHSISVLPNASCCSFGGVWTPGAGSQGQAGHGIRSQSQKRLGSRTLRILGHPVNRHGLD
jgi:hypothetical protein